MKLVILQVFSVNSAAWPGAPVHIVSPPNDPALALKVGNDATYGALLEIDSERQFTLGN
jgi:hypothetical protein